MRRIFVSQRVEIIECYNERRDAVDQNIARFILALGALPIPLCNLPEMTKEYVKELKPDGIMLTGGNDLSSYGGDSPERDLTEQQLIEISLEDGLPLIGFCRGMQIIADYFGAKLEKIEGHVAVRHSLHGLFIREVNSYHNYGCLDLPLPLESLARTEDGVIEALRHKSAPITGIMWHPERETPFQSADIELIKGVLQ